MMKKLLIEIWQRLKNSLCNIRGEMHYPLHNVVKAIISRKELKDNYIYGLQQEVEYQMTGETVMIDTKKILSQVMIKIIGGKYKIVSQ